MGERFETGIIVTVFFASVFFGCTRDSENDSIGPEIKSEQTASTRTDSVISPDIIDERIGIIEEYLKRRDIPDNNRETAGSLLDSYRKIRTTLDSPVEDQYREINHILFDSMIMLEERCLNLLISEGVREEEMREPEDNDPPPERTVGTVLPIDLLEIMISMLEGYLERKDISIEDRETARIFLSGYRKISSINKSTASEDAYREITQIHLDTMIMVEERIIN